MNWLHRQSKRMIKKDEDQKQQEFFSRISQAQSVFSDQRDSCTANQGGNKRALQLQEQMSGPTSSASAPFQSFVNPSVNELIEYGRDMPKTTSKGLTVPIWNSRTEQLQLPEILFQRGPRNTILVKENEGKELDKSHSLMISSPQRPLSTWNKIALPRETFAAKKVMFSDSIRIVSGCSETESETTPSSGRDSYNTGTPCSDNREIALLSKALRETAMSTPVKRGSSLDESPFGTEGLWNGKRKSESLNSPEEPTYDSNSEHVAQYESDEENESPKKRPRSESHYEKKLLCKKESSDLRLGENARRGLVWGGPLTEIEVTDCPVIGHNEQCHSRPLVPMGEDISEKKNTHLYTGSDDLSGSFEPPSTVDENSITNPTKVECGCCPGKFTEEADLDEDMMTGSQLESSIESSDSRISGIIDDCVEKMLEDENVPSRKIPMEYLYQTFRMTYFLENVFYGTVTTRR